MRRMGYKAGTEKMKIKRITAVVLLFLLLCGSISLDAFAEKKTAVITTLQSSGKLAVSFQFDKAEVPITLISPDNKRYSEGSDGLSVYRGDKWALYEIENAAAGEWQAEYDLGANSSITYHILEQEGGISIMEFSVSDITGSSAKAHFKVDRPGEQINYSYTITATDNTLYEGEDVEVARGSAESGEAVDEEVDLSGLSSSESVTLNLFIEGYSPNGTEEFDNRSTDAFSFTNSSAPEAMENYIVFLDQTARSIEVDWSKNAGGNTHRVRVVADDREDDALINDVVESDITSTFTYYPEDSEKLTVYLSYEDNGVFSQPKIKEIDLVDGEYLKTAEAKASATGEIVLSYRSEEQSVLSVFTEEFESPDRNSYESNADYLDALRSLGAEQYAINGEGEVSVPMNTPEADLYAEFLGQDNIYYTVDALKQYNSYPPEIILYEDPDGMTFEEEEIELAGRVSYGNLLTLNDEEVELGEDGGFSTTLTLEKGENLFTLKARNALGNEAQKVLTVYRGTGDRTTERSVGDDTSFNAVVKKELERRGLSPWLPALAALAASVLLILAALIFIRKDPKRSGAGLVFCIILNILTAALTGGAVYLFRTLGARTADMEFLSMMETSFDQAKEYMHTQKLVGTAAVVFLIMFAASVVLTVLTVIWRRKRKAR